MFERQNSQLTPLSSLFRSVRCTDDFHDDRINFRIRIILVPIIQHGPK
jgi:hypothetical protein